MKITIDIDCTPEEARSFLGLPDMSAFNEQLTAEMSQRAKDNMDTLADPERYVAQALQSGGKGMEAFQAMMMNAMAGNKP